ncbi:MAG: hypothetical protein IK095_05160 [Oscillospiraceae bacterium]|nr:hypothetical protein [Oscillospiraceae bacterium]
MIFKNLVMLCRAHKRILLYGGPDGTQWIGEGNAIYPLHGMPPMDRTALPVVFDVQQKDLGKYTIKHEDALPSIFDYHDTAPEMQLQPEPISLVLSGALLRPLRTSRGLMFYDPDYLRPLRDLQDTLEIYERATAQGQVYFAVKSGLLLQALILPLRVDKVRLLTLLQAMEGALLEAVESERDEEDEG